ncbi:hypothetical protein BH11MYX4_BH11MYX4_02290 [soil metagenome]
MSTYPTNGGRPARASSSPTPRTQVDGKLANRLAAGSTNESPVLSAANSMFSAGFPTLPLYRETCP